MALCLAVNRLLKIVNNEPTNALAIANNIPNQKAWLTMNMRYSPQITTMLSSISGILGICLRSKGSSNAVKSETVEKHMSAIETFDALMEA